MKKYGDYGFTMLSVCLEVARSMKKALERFELVGINVLTQGRWERKLKETYTMSRFPHHVLIDRQGNIVEMIL
jgi:hypothetical protein